MLNLVNRRKVCLELETALETVSLAPEMHPTSWQSARSMLGGRLAGQRLDYLIFDLTIIKKVVATGFRAALQINRISSSLL